MVSWYVIVFVWTQRVTYSYQHCLSSGSQMWGYSFCNHHKDKYDARRECSECCLSWTHTSCTISRHERKGVVYVYDTNITRHDWYKDILSQLFTHRHWVTHIDLMYVMNIHALISCLNWRRLDEDLATTNINAVHFWLTRAYISVVYHLYVI